MLLPPAITKGNRTLFSKMFIRKKAKADTWFQPFSFLTATDNAQLHFRTFFVFFYVLRSSLAVPDNAYGSTYRRVISDISGSLPERDGNLTFAFSDL